MSQKDQKIWDSFLKHQQKIIRGVLEGYLVHPKRNNPGCTGGISGAP